MGSAPECPTEHSSLLGGWEGSDTHCSTGDAHRFQIPPGDLTAAKGLGNIDLLIPRPLHITLFSVVLCHSLACTETGPAKPSLSKPSYLHPDLSASTLTRSQGLLCTAQGQKEWVLTPWGSRRHRMMLRTHRAGHKGKAGACLGGEESRSRGW